MSEMKQYWIEPNPWINFLETIEFENLELHLFAEKKHSFIGRQLNLLEIPTVVN